MNRTDPEPEIFGQNAGIPGNSGNEDNTAQAFRHGGEEVEKLWKM